MALNLQASLMPVYSACLLFLLLFLVLLIILSHLQPSLLSPQRFFRLSHRSLVFILLLWKPGQEVEEPLS